MQAQNWGRYPAQNYRLSRRHSTVRAAAGHHPCHSMLGHNVGRSAAPFRMIGALESCHSFHQAHFRVYSRLQRTRGLSGLPGQTSGELASASAGRIMIDLCQNTPEQTCYQG